jgi:Na+-driven multidrug efflux pump
MRDFRVPAIGISFAVTAIVARRIGGKNPERGSGN